MTFSDTDKSKELEQNLNTLPQWAKDLILQLMTRTKELEARVRELEGQIAKNSSNSGISMRLNL